MFLGVPPPLPPGGAVKHFHITIVMLFPFKRIWSSLVILRPSGVFSLLKLTINYWHQIKSVKFRVQLALPYMESMLSLHFNSPVALIFMCNRDIFGFFGWNILTTGRLTHNIKGLSYSTMADVMSYGTHWQPWKWLGIYHTYDGA